MEHAAEGELFEKIIKERRLTEIQSAKYFS